jgi:hypothetical protein
MRLPSETKLIARSLLARRLIRLVRHAVRAHRCWPVAHCQENVPGFLFGLDVLRRLHHSLERVATVDDIAVLAGLDNVFDETDVLPT